MSRVSSRAWWRVVAAYCRRVGLAKLLVVLAAAASLTPAGSATDAEVMRGSALDADATAGRADAKAVDLESLRSKSAAVTAASRTVYAEAAHILDRLANSGFPDEQVRAEAITALRTVVRLSHQLGVRSLLLADAVEAASAEPQPA